MPKQPVLNKLLSLSLSLVLAGQGLAAWAADSPVLSGDVRVTVTPANIQETLPVPGAERKVTMSFRGVGIQDALRALAKQGGFNVLIDESVDGAVSLDLHDVSIQNALAMVRTYGNLAYSVQGKNLLVADADSERGRSFQKTRGKIVPLRHANARVIANLLNTTVFADRAAQTGGSGGSAGGTGNAAAPMPVTPDFHTNSLIVVGSPTDIKLVEEHVAALDTPREMKTWRLSQANALDVATFLSSSLFNEGQPALSTGSSGGGSGSGAGASSGGSGGSSSPIRVTAENIEEGSGTSEASQSGGSSSGGDQESLVNSLTLRARVKTSQTVQVNPNGPIIIPDTRLNTITLLGTAEQIAMAEAMMPVLDRKVPQVVLEATLIEISEEANRELIHSSAWNSRNFSSGSNNSPLSTSQLNQLFSNTIGRQTNISTPFESIYQFSTNSLTAARDFAYQLRALVNNNKARVLANPTVVTTSDNETIISIVDEIVRSVTVTQGFGLPPTATTNLGEAGIVLNILPKVGADNTVSMRIRPLISSVADIRTDSFDNQVTLLSKREVLAQNVVLKDGETFILAGLVHNTNQDVVRSHPLLSRLPIVGALARSSVGAKHKSELVVMITPHIINDESAVARSASAVPTSKMVPATLSKPGTDGFVPVSMSEKPRRSAIPPLEEVNVIGGTGEGANLELKPKAVPRAQHIGSLKPEELRLAPKTSEPPPVRTVVTRQPAAAKGAKAGSTISDAEIRAIMEKFK